MDDQNIFHFFAVEAHEVWTVLQQTGGGRFRFVLEHYDPKSQAHRWRKDLLKALVGSSGAVVTSKRKDHALVLNNGGWMFDCWKFIKYRPCPFFVAMEARLKANLGLQQSSDQVVFVQRVSSRVLIDARTKRLLEEELVRHFPSLRVVRFEDLDTLARQAHAVSNARVLIACHGAGLTNMVFAPAKCHVIEVSFRGTDSWRLQRLRYHKADFHNLRPAFGRRGPLAGKYGARPRQGLHRDPLPLDRRHLRTAMAHDRRGKGPRKHAQGRQRHQPRPIRKGNLVAG
jgi:hypothetical protein